ncbi:hypothetical protein [Polyangium sp. y55x31]|uniref:hypothetical protein n=1 Tax=Polyangium sp. y55x31 TaxID=3042688 RepID=UPI002482AD71|nr:hypothetical protein [Polyangium sp. y55x31]MDI1482241.1 hypothetical protein [Polyangium sp. y55x31]
MRDSIIKWAGSAAFLLSLAPAAMGCQAEGSVVYVPVGRNTGTVTQSWSIGGRFDRSLCRTYGADRMELVIRDTSGRTVARAYQPCEEMQMSVRLPEGTYRGDATLIARDGSEVSTTLELQPFRILSNTDTLIDTDFPTSSMLTVLSVDAVAASESVDESAP